MGDTPRQGAEELREGVGVFAQVAWSVGWILGLVALLAAYGPRSLQAASAVLHRVLPSALFESVPWADVPLLILGSFVLQFCITYVAVRYLRAPRSLWVAALIAAAPFTIALGIDFGAPVVGYVAALFAGKGPVDSSETLRVLGWFTLSLAYAAGNVSASYAGARRAALRMSAPESEWL